MVIVRSAPGLKFGLVRVRVNNAVRPMRKNNSRRTRTTFFNATFRAGIIRFRIRKDDINKVGAKDKVWTDVKNLIW